MNFRSLVSLRPLALIALFIILPIAGAVNPTVAQPPTHFTCQFVPHRGGESTSPDLGFVNFLASSGYYRSAITLGTIEALITETTASFSRVVIESDSVLVDRDPTGIMRFGLRSPSEGLFNRDAGYQAIQIKLSLSVEFADSTSQHHFDALFKGQLETAPEGKALAGQITTESTLELPLFGKVLVLLIRVFCVYG